MSDRDDLRRRVDRRVREFTRFLVYAVVGLNALTAALHLIDGERVQANISALFAIVLLLAWFTPDCRQVRDLEDRLERLEVDRDA